ncbi:MAG: sulfide/dihydroorotate dehydrogenase-like FAD/NAD-binding protein [Elusimicrobia bacterium]|nr:sulfide/dihydroorotate dehydrogenase-like FAD/NAD-binding protein [Elusimicrobiota bacterium]MDD7502552.1 sulfide/dihydroorotate dehydrogenase-like FAD/NAD-binding protein [Elusimicrobiota bacterium]MDY5729020.1 sulfide/dihydroorotate dehydrogenase-like FAD/NAD-binding protein [Elusimicrobiaceae bacterium]
MEENTILVKENLSDVVVKFVIYKPLIAKSAQAGQFVILRGREGGERVPVTLVDWDKEKGTITVIIQAIGKSTKMFNSLKQGEKFLNVAGPLGTPVEIKNYGTVAVVGGGVGIAEVYPIARAFKEAGNRVIAVLGARTKDLLILEPEMSALCDKTVSTTDDGSFGMKGMVTDAIQKLHDAGEKINAGFIIGPIPMMKFTSRLMDKLGMEPHASLNPIMLDGTGMCGCCRVTVEGKVRFACVEGPMFPSKTIDFDELIRRTGEYRPLEAESLALYQKDHVCKCGLH